MKHFICFSLGVITLLISGCGDDSTTSPSSNPPPYALNHVWSKNFGGDSRNFGESIACDESGNVVVTGYFEVNIDFGGGIFTSAGYNDVFLAKFDANGKHLWSKSFGDVKDQFGLGTACDISGNVVVTGYFEETINFGGGTLNSVGNSDLFLAKFDADGNHLWSKSFSNANGNGVAFDGSGNIVVTGAFSSTVDFGGGVLTSEGGADIFLAKFDANGNHIWCKHFGDADNQRAYSVACDGLGNIVITGSLSGSADFGGGIITSTGYSDIFLAQFDANGNHIWSKIFGDENDSQIGKSVNCDGSGNVAITGYFQGSVDFGDGTLMCTGLNDIFLAKFDVSGDHLWSKRFGDVNKQLGMGVACDGSGNVMVTGYFSGSVDFGGGSLNCEGDEDIFLAQFDVDGSHLWSKRFGDGSDLNTGRDVVQTAQGVTCDGSGNVLMTGGFWGTVNFGSGTLNSAGGIDVFIVKFKH